LDSIFGVYTIVKQTEDSTGVEPS